MPINALVGREILIVEDDYYCASEISEALAGAGSVVLGPVPTVEEAHNIIENSRPFAAILDAKIREGFSFSIADRLSELEVPFIFVSGYDCAEMPEKYQRYTWLSKPPRMSHVLRKLANAIEDTAPRMGMLDPPHVNRAG